MKELSEFKKAIEKAELLLSGTKDQILVPDLYHGYVNELNTLQAVGARNDWARRARVKWLELGLEAWEAWVPKARHTNLPPIQAGEFPSSEVLHMDWKVLDFYLTVSWVGTDCNRLIDRFLKSLKDLYLANDDRVEIAGAMDHLITRRTGCSRDGDPHRDELARKLLMQYYGL